MPHYRSMFSSKYAGAWDFEHGDRQAKIVSVAPVTIKDRKGVEEMKPLVTFSPEAGLKPLVLNKTNGATIAQMFGDDVLGWIGQTITLYRATVEMAGEQVYAVRVRLNVAPPPAAARRRQPKAAAR